MSDVIRLVVMRAGGPTRVARRFKISRNAVHRWIYRGIVPSERVLDLCEMAGGNPGPTDVRPDIYPKELFSPEKIVMVEKWNGDRRQQHQQ